MLRKAVLISCALFLSMNLAIFSEQSGEQKPKDIEQQLKEATMARKVGSTVLVLGGISVALGGGFFIAYLAKVLDYAMYWHPEDARWAKIDGDVATGTIIGGLLAMGLGGFLMIGAQQKIGNIKKSQIALQLLGPDLAEGKSLGGISLIYSY